MPGESRDLSDSRDDSEHVTVCLAEDHKVSVQREGGVFGLSQSQKDVSEM